MRIHYKKLKNHLLIAMPTIKDELFSHSVCLICQHGKTGTVGFVINKQVIAKECDLLVDHGFKINKADFNQHLMVGGPVNKDRGFVVHTDPALWPNAAKISKKLFITTSKDMLAAIAEKKMQHDYVIFLGYACWKPMQLEEELKKGDWLVGKASHEILFDIPCEYRWEHALQQVGVKNPYQLMNQLNQTQIIHT